MGPGWLADASGLSALLPHREDPTWRTVPMGPHALMRIEAVKIVGNPQRMISLLTSAEFSFILQFFFCFVVVVVFPLC